MAITYNTVRETALETHRREQRLAADEIARITDAILRANPPEVMLASACHTTDIALEVPAAYWQVCRDNRDAVCTLLKERLGGHGVYVFETSRALLVSYTSFVDDAESTGSTDSLV